MDGQTDGQTDRETDGQVENTCASLDWWRYNKGYKQPEIDTLTHINLNIQNDNLLASHLAEHQTECTGSFLSLTNSALLAEHQTECTGSFLSRTNSALLAYSIPQSTPQARSEMTQGTTPRAPHTQTRSVHTQACSEMTVDRLRTTTVSIPYSCIFEFLQIVQNH